MKKGITSILVSAIILLVCFNGGSASAQRITQTQIPYGPPVVVNFQERADYETLHPVKKKRRNIEQGEDVDENFRFTGKTPPADAIHFMIHPQSQVNQVQTVSPAPSFTPFNGTMDNSSLIPPDIRGAAGLNYIMETTNQEFKIYNKAGGLVSTLSITGFFTGSGGTGYFDPHIFYDPNNARFVACITGKLSSNSHGAVFLAVSKTSDPTGAWWVYGFDAAGNTTDFIDFPLLGFNTNWVVVTVNDFLNGSNPVGKIYVLNRANLYAGTQGTVSTFTDNNGFSMAPAHTQDAAQTTEYIVQDWNGNSSGNGYVQLGTITGTASAPVYTAGATLAVNQPWSETSVGAQQSGSTRTLESGDTRITQSILINGSLWFSHTVYLPASGPNHSGVDWWQINPATNTLQQFGRLDPGTSNFYFYPSINVNINNDVLLGYCTSSSATFAGAAYSYRTAADPANSMQSSLTYKSGVAAYYKTYSGTRNRWGDYTGTAVDPSNNSFWNFSQWANTSNLWGTVIANVPASSTVFTCSVPTGLNTTGITTAAATFNWSAAGGTVTDSIRYHMVGAATWTSVLSSSISTYTASGLAQGTNFEWEVMTNCSSGNSGWSSPVAFTTLVPTACNIPTVLGTTSITSSSATFSWTAASGTVTDSIRYHLTGAATWTTVLSASTASYTANGLAASSNYEWAAKTNCSSGNSAWTSPVAFTTTAPAACNVPTGLSTSAITSSSATFNWTAASGTVTDSVRYHLTGAATWTSIRASSTASYAVSGLVASSNYEWAVKTNCSSGGSAWSSPVAFTTSAASSSCTNNYEPNDASTSAASINTGADIYSMINPSTDIDYFQFNNSSTQPNMKISLSNLPGDYDIRLYAPSGIRVAISQNGGTTAESIIYNTTTVGTYKVRVYGYGGAYSATQCYLLRVNLGSTAFGPVFNGDISAGGKIQQGGLLNLYPNPAQDNLTIEYTSEQEGQANLRVYNLVGQDMMDILSTVEAGINVLNLNTTALSKGIYLLEITRDGQSERQKFSISR